MKRIDKEKVIDYAFALAFIIGLIFFAIHYPVMFFILLFFVVIILIA